MYSGIISIPMEFRYKFLATLNVVPEPAKGSKTVSYSFVNNFINHSGKASGNAAL